MISKVALYLNEPVGRICDRHVNVIAKRLLMTQSDVISIAISLGYEIKCSKLDCNEVK